jgi:hypothetical protein
MAWVPTDHLLVPGVGGFEAVAFGGQRGGEDGSAGRADMVVLGAGVGGSAVGVDLRVGPVRLEPTIGGYEKHDPVHRAR